MRIGCGFLFADGCINKNRILLSLGSKDKEHLCKFAEYIGGNITNVNKLNKIIAYKTNKNNEKLAKLYKSYGIIENKTYLQHNCPINLIPCDLQNSWLRGYFDGDGWILPTRGNGKKRNPVLGFITYNSKLLNELIIYIGEKLGINNIKIRTKKNIKKDKNLSFNYYLEINKTKDILKIRNFLYNEQTICLERKFEKFNIIEAQYLSAQKQNLLRKKSPYIGVSKHNKTGLWQARIFNNGVGKSLGYFRDEVMAAKAYDDAAIILNRDTLNFKN